MSKDNFKGIHLKIHFIGDVIHTYTTPQYNFICIVSLLFSLYTQRQLFCPVIIL